MVAMYPIFMSYFIKLTAAGRSFIVTLSFLPDTLVSLITVEAQSYGPNSLIGIKVVEYCPPPPLTGGAAEGMPGAVGPPVGTQQGQSAQGQPPGQVTQKSKSHNNC